MDSFIKRNKIEVTVNQTDDDSIDGFVEYKIAVKYKDRMFEWDYADTGNIQESELSPDNMLRYMIYLVMPFVEANGYYETWKVMESKYDTDEKTLKSTFENLTDWHSNLQWLFGKVKFKELLNVYKDLLETQDKPEGSAE